MRYRVSYVLGGPLQPDIERRKLIGEQPLSEFNVFSIRNRAQVVATDQVKPGLPTSLRRRIALARAVTGRRDDYDILVASGEDIGIPLAVASLVRRVHTPIWIILHGFSLDNTKFSLVAPALRRARHVQFLCLSESLRGRMVETYGFDRDRCHDAGYGIDTAFFQPGPPAEEPLVVAAGSANRDYRTLIAATEGLNVPLRIAADSLWRPKAADIDPTVLPSSVDVGSAGSYGGLRALYQRASFVVVPLHAARHASGYAVIGEAMAMGKAVITTRTEAPSDLVVEGETGFYTRPGDIEGLREKVVTLLDDPARARAMGSAAAQRIRDQFSLDAYCSRIERIIDPSDEAIP